MENISTNGREHTVLATWTGNRMKKKEQRWEKCAGVMHRSAIDIIICFLIKLIFFIITGHLAATLGTMVVVEDLILPLFFL